MVKSKAGQRIDGRALAPHVQAAIAQAAQPKMGWAAGERGGAALAPHVQSAIGRTPQPKLSPGVLPGSAVQPARKKGPNPIRARIAAGADIAAEEKKEVKLSPGCMGKPFGCPVVGMPAKVYRWQSAKSATIVPPADKGIPTAGNGKAAAAMGALSTDFLAEIDRDAVAASLLAGTPWYEIVGSRRAGWEYKIWVTIPAAAITWCSYENAPAEHKPARD